MASITFKKYDRNILWIAGGGIVLFLITMLTVPIADDWSYLTSPKIVSGYRLAQFRRTFDILIGLFNQTHPETFPWLNRILIVASHTVSAALLYKIASGLLGVRQKLALVFSMLFLIGGNTIITVLNYDCFNQTGSLMFGAVGVYLFSKVTGTAKKFAIYFVSCILSLLCKEAGIVYFAIIPLFGFVVALNSNGFDLKKELKTLAIFCIPGLLCALAYYLSPIIQSEQLWVYGIGNDTLSQYIRGIARRLCHAYTPVNETMIAALTYHEFTSARAILAYICIALTLPLVVLTLATLIKCFKTARRKAAVFLLIALTSIIVFTPTLIATPTGSIWSLNCIVFFANIALSYILSQTETKGLSPCLLAYALCSVISCAHLVYLDIQTGMRQSEGLEKIRDSYDNDLKVSKYLVINLNGNRITGYYAYPYHMEATQKVLEDGASFISIFGNDAKLLGSD